MGVLAKTSESPMTLLIEVHDDASLIEDSLLGAR